MNIHSMEKNTPCKDHVSICIGIFSGSKIFLFKSYVFVAIDVKSSRFFGSSDPMRDVTQFWSAIDAQQRTGMTLKSITEKIGDGVSQLISL